jgi:hypothetical protein
MHFQLDDGPVDADAVDWSTVPDSIPTPKPPEEDEMVLEEGDQGNAVKSMQRALNNWSSGGRIPWSEEWARWESNPRPWD